MREEGNNFFISLTLYWTRSFWCGGPLGQSCGISDYKIPINSSSPVNHSDSSEFTKELYPGVSPYCLCQLEQAAPLLCPSGNLLVSVPLTQTIRRTQGAASVRHSGLCLAGSISQMFASGFAIVTIVTGASQVATVVGNPPANAGDIRDSGSVCGSGRSPRGGHGNPLQHSCLENPVDRGAWRATVHGSHTELDMTERLCIHACMIITTMFVELKIKPFRIIGSEIITFHCFRGNLFIKHDSKLQP